MKNRIELPPTAKEIGKEIDQYVQALKMGSEPVQIITTILASDSDLLEITVKIKNPPKSKWLKEFIIYLQNRIGEATRPPQKNN